jgi:hypothetical protein
MVPSMKVRWPVAVRFTISSTAVTNRRRTVDPLKTSLGATVGKVGAVDTGALLIGYQ